MAALLHQAALQPPHPTPHPNHPWMHSSLATSMLSPPHAAPSKRQPAPARRLHAAGNGNGSGVDTPAADSASTNAPPSLKKTSRKEKLRQQQRVREREEQQQLLLKESLVEAAREEESRRGGNDDDEIPQVVFDRILKRILFTVGIPMASGVALLNIYDALKRGGGLEVPSWVQLLTILLSFGTSAGGIAYGTLSTSWDPDKEGSLLGIDELQTNWPELWKEDDKKDDE
ncbi:protein PAM68, chloroplastic-like [Lolium rigidum]|uniref:protein PAM68, chloroplastic-like n=1 Tax=Lolium rigidum TaxID=89674 RepID=UPI001F5C4BF8|nr:protein PAM68, chloroplastic-like [Lolium rigidum]